MNAVVLGQTLRSGGRGLLGYAVGLLIVLSSGTLGFEAIQQQSENLRGMIASLPPALTSAFQFGVDSFSSREGYFAARALSLLWPLLLIVFAAGAGAAIAAMVERGTVHYELNLPVSRSRWLSSRFGGALLGAALLLGLTGLGVWVGTQTAPWGFLALASGFVLFWLGVAFLAASSVRERGAVYGLTLGLFGLFFLLTTLGRTVSGLDWLERVSVWSLYTPEPTLRGVVDWAAVLGLGLGGLLLFGLALLRWRGRDLPA